MAYFDQFTIPIKGLHLGIHEYSFVIDEEFFRRKENTQIESGLFNVEVTLDKHIDLIMLEISFIGSWNTMCDRCTADIPLPVQGHSEYLIKYAAKESDDGDIIYIMKETTELNLSDLILDSIIIGLPISKTFDCDSLESRPCDMVTLSKLDQWTDEKTSPQQNDLWALLKGLQLEEE
ncbi:MAG: DUF177 domain-containing protein [Saprospiraceae bacterium]|nr:DUF177 domain-containing protein [Saprospiraceae bacterium]